MKPKPFNARRLEYADLLRQARRRLQKQAARAEQRDLRVEGTAPRRGGNQLIEAAGMVMVVALAGLVWILPGWRASAKTAFKEGIVTAPDSPSLLSPGECADAFLKATTHGERLRFIRHPELVGPIMQQFFQTGPGATETVEDHKPIVSRQLNPLVMGRSYTVSGRYYVAMRDGRPHRLLSTVEENGETKVDFHAYARHTDPPWSEITAGRATEAVVRVTLTPGEYYQAPFGNSNEWVALRASHPDLPTDLTFYVPRSDSNLAQLTNLPSGQNLRYLLKIAPVEKSWSQKQFEVKAILSPDWLEPAPDTPDQ